LVTGSLVHCSFKEKILLIYTWSVLKHIKNILLNNIKSSIFTPGGLQYFYENT